MIPGDFIRFVLFDLIVLFLCFCFFIDRAQFPFPFPFLFPFPFPFLLVSFVSIKRTGIFNMDISGLPRLTPDPDDMWPR